MIPFVTAAGQLPVHCAAAGGNLNILAWLVEDRCCPLFLDREKKVRTVPIAWKLPAGFARFVSDPSCTNRMPLPPGYTLLTYRSLRCGPWGEGGAVAAWTLSGIQPRKTDTLVYLFGATVMDREIAQDG